jgi:hypothetical protein
MKIVCLIVIFLVGVFASTLFSNANAQILVPGIHGISMIPGLKFTWVIISNAHEVSLNIRYTGNGTTPPVTLTVTALTNPTMTLNQTSMPSTIAASQVINAGWTSPNSTTIKFNEIPSLLKADIVTVVASPYTSINQSGCDPSYPDFCISFPPPLLNCEQITQKNFTVLSPDSHGFDRDKDGIGCDENE